MMNLADKLAQLCCEKYNTLGKRGKPNDKEWTVLAGIVLNDCGGNLSVVSLATGTKCLSGTELMDSKRWEIGSRLSDSHAEVLARRAFLRYLYHQVNLLLTDNDSEIFEFDSRRKISLKSEISFHYFCSQTPCGDCSIFPKSYEDGTAAVGASVRKRKTDRSEEIEVKRAALDQEHRDVHRTGAKCVHTEKEQDPHLPGINYHIVGPLRIKPGRGDRTLSLSCSDKMAKWNAVGIQGALLSRLIPPVSITSFCIGGECPFSVEAMQRGICDRFSSDRCPVFIQSTQSFTHKKGTARIQPCPSSIIWSAVPDRQLEISVDGRKQGVTKKKIRGNYLSVSRRELFKTFLNTFEGLNEITYNERNHPKKITYFHVKHSSTAYQESWRKLKLQSFHAWPAKPSYLQEFILT